MVFYLLEILQSHHDPWSCGARRGRARLSKRFMNSVVYIGQNNFTETMIVMDNIDISTKIRYDTYGKLLKINAGVLLYNYYYNYV